MNKIVVKAIPINEFDFDKVILCSPHISELEFGLKQRHIKIMYQHSADTYGPIIVDLCKEYYCIPSRDIENKLKITIPNDDTEFINFCNQFVSFMIKHRRPLKKKDLRTQELIITHFNDNNKKWFYSKLYSDSKLYGPGDKEITLDSIKKHFRIRPQIRFDRIIHSPPCNIFLRYYLYEANVYPYKSSNLSDFLKTANIPHQRTIPKNEEPEKDSDHYHFTGEIDFN